MFTHTLRTYVSSMALLYADEIKNDDEIDGSDAVDVLVAKVGEAQALLAGESEDTVTAVAAPSDAVGTPHPDEPTNRTRAARIDAVLREHAISAGMEPKDKPGDWDITDLLTDIRHWCNEHKVAFDYQVFRSYDHYREELPEASGQATTVMAS